MMRQCRTAATDGWRAQELTPATRHLLRVSSSLLPFLPSCWLALLAVIALCAPGAVRASTPAKRLVVIVVPGLRAEDLVRPELSALRERVALGAVGWMNTRTARVAGQWRDPEEAAYLTLGAGSRATAGAYADVVNADSLARLRRENERLDHPVRIGALGDLLRAAGVVVGVEGAEDDVQTRRAAQLVGMDSRGHVDGDRTDPHYWAVFGRQEWEGVPADLWPYGTCQGARSPLNDLGRSGPPFQICVFGDVARADRYAPLCLPHVAMDNRRRALANLDRYLATTTQPPLPGDDAPPHTRYILLAPCPAGSADPVDRLSPILEWGNGVAPGLLTSGSTRTAGLVANTDFLPTVAAFFGLKPPTGTVGRPMTVTPLAPGSALVELFRQVVGSVPIPNTQYPTPVLWSGLHDRWLVHARQQAAFGGLPALQAAAVAIGTVAAVWFRRRKAGDGRDSVQSAKCKMQSGAPTLPRPHDPTTRLLAAVRGGAAVVVAALPLALFVLPVVSPAALWADGLVLGGVLLGSAAVVALRHAATRPVVFGLLAALAAACTLDLLAGAHLMRQAWMSYSAMEGARYYGIGNEYEGAVVGGALSASGWLLRGDGIRRWPWVVAALLVMTAVIGWPGFGAKAGGVLGTAVAVLVAWAVWRRGHLRVRDVATAVGVAVVCLCAILAFDLLQGSAERSHIAHGIGSGENVAGIAERKLALNGWLLLHSPWSLAMAAAAAGIWLLWRRPDSLLRTCVLADRGLRGGAAGLVACAVALLLVNDSGVVAAAEALLVGWAAAMAVDGRPTNDQRPLTTGDERLGAASAV